MMKQKTLLRYPGGKSFAVKAIIPYFPDDITEMVSPFFGGGSIEIECALSGIRVWGYDIFEPLVHFWQHVLNKNQELYDKISEYPIPLPKEKFYEMQKGFKDLTDPLEIAAQFYILNRCSFSGTTLSGGMSPSQKNWNERSKERIKNFNLGSGLFSSNDLLSVNNKDFSESLEKHSGIFAYLDPPYLLEKSTLYGNRGSTHKDFDHIKLHEILSNRTTPWALSYNDHPELLELYNEYNIYRPAWRYAMKSKGGCKDSYEIVVTNY